MSSMIQGGVQFPHRQSIRTLSKIACDGHWLSCDQDIKRSRAQENLIDGRMSIEDDISLRLPLTTIPLEVFRIILDKVYDEQNTLTIAKPHNSTQATTSDLPISPFRVNHLLYTKYLDAIRRSKNNTISVKPHASFSDTTSIPKLPSLSSPSPPLSQPSTSSTSPANHRSSNPGNRPAQIYDR